MLTALLGPLVSGIFGVIDKAVEDKDQAIQIKAKLQEMVLTGQMKEIEAAAQIIVAVFVIGGIGFLLDRIMLVFQRLVTFEDQNI